MTTGALERSGFMGVRVSPTGELASGEDLASVYDTHTGRLLCLMSYPFGRLRVAATMTLAVRLLAAAGADTVGLIGTGRNARDLLRGICTDRQVSAVRVYSRDEQRRRAFAVDTAAELAIPVEPAASAEAAVAGAGIVLVATSSQEPVVTRGWLSVPGVLVASMGRPGELDRSVYLDAGLIVVGHKGHERGWFDRHNSTHRLVELADAGEVGWDSVVELCDVVAGNHPGRTSGDALIVFKESQGGYGDVALAAYVYEQARQQGLGIHIDLNEDGA
jgi:ornithine cyclodeaminase/alanine dehydrogenase-like protein (mu-crystallin family)